MRQKPATPVTGFVVLGWGNRYRPRPLAHPGEAAHDYAREPYGFGVARIRYFVFR